MIRHLHLTDVGPSRSLEFTFARRLNVLTGDNGLGKTFVLDIVWWILTTTWTGEKAFPWRPGPGSKIELRPEITAEFGPEGKNAFQGGNYEWATQEWLRLNPPTWRMDGSWGLPRSLVVYARIDGTFAIWDAAQVRSGPPDLAVAAVSIDGVEVWEGKEVDEPGAKRRRTVCRGLIEDWVSWQGTRSQEFEALQQVLLLLSDPDEPLVPGPPTRVRLDDRRDIPTLSTPYGEVPVTLASAGVRRVLALAYLLVWAWSEHVKASAVTQKPLTPDVIVLIDEVELHLHPSWQRVLLPAVFKAMGSLAPEAQIQVVATTHSPLVLSSLEAWYNEDIDSMFHLERDGRVVDVKEVPFIRQGDVSNWLVSDAIGLEGTRSREAEPAIEAAMAFMRGEQELAERCLTEHYARVASLPPSGHPVESTGQNRALVDRIHAALVATLPDHDRFWPRWIVTAEREQRRRTRRPTYKGAKP